MLRLLELGSSFVTALAEQRQPMTGLMRFASRARVTWIEQEHGWVAASEEIVMGPSKEGFSAFWSLVRPWHQAIVDVDRESLKGR